MNRVTRIFDWNCQRQFAAASGDYNPIHIDAIASRRTTAGAPIVHGMHSLIWLLDCLSGAGYTLIGPTRLNVQLVRPIYVGEEVAAEISGSSQGEAGARILVAGDVAVAASLNRSDAGPCSGVMLSNCVEGHSPPDVPADLAIEQLDGFRGKLAFDFGRADLQRMFPAAATGFGLNAVAALACSSCLVGMEIPGLHSMYLGLNLILVGDKTSVGDGLDYQARVVSARFGAVRIEIWGVGVQGTLEVLRRPPPAKQPDMDQVRSLIAPDEFQGTRALIIGGSRGLGELTAKIISAGGGDVVLTYLRGKTDAESVLAQIEGGGGRGSAMRYDTALSAWDQIAEIVPAPTQIYYFATPRIARPGLDVFDRERFAEFTDVYVDSFLDLVKSCARWGTSRVRVFYPSTTFIERRPKGMTEYAMAKAAAEVMCRDISGKVEGVEIMSRRLPRVATDQTLSTVQVALADSAGLIRDVVRAMHAE